MHVADALRLRCRTITSRSLCSLPSGDLPALSLLIAGDLLRYEEGAIHESPSGFAADPEQALASRRESDPARGFIL